MNVSKNGSTNLKDTLTYPSTSTSTLSCWGNLTGPAVEWANNASWGKVDPLNNASRGKGAPLHTLIKENKENQENTNSDSQEHRPVHVELFEKGNEVEPDLPFRKRFKFETDSNTFNKSNNNYQSLHNDQKNDTNMINNDNNINNNNNNNNNNNTLPLTYVEPAINQRIGSRLFLETERVAIFLKALEAFIEVSPSQQPRTVAFDPDGIFFTVGVPTEERQHSLHLPKSFWAKYYCMPKGFRVILDLMDMYKTLSHISNLHRGECIRITDKPDNRLIVEVIKDGKACNSLPPSIVPLKPGGAAICVRVTPLVYHRYPMMLLVDTHWIGPLLRNLVKWDIHQVEVEFDGSTRKLNFYFQKKGELICETCEVAVENVLDNPFLPDKYRTHLTIKGNSNCHFNSPPGQPHSMNENNTSSTSSTSSTTNTNDNKNDNKNERLIKDSRIIYVDTANLAKPAASTVPEKFQFSKERSLELIQSLKEFHYRSTFVARSLLLPFKKHKLGRFAHLFLNPGHPLLIQYLLESDITDCRTAATFCSWIRASNDPSNLTRPIIETKNVSSSLSSSSSSSPLAPSVTLLPTTLTSTVTPTPTPAVVIQPTVNKDL
jgi:hypothetical protein